MSEPFSRNGHFLLPRLVSRRGTPPSARQPAHALAFRASRSCDTPEATRALPSRPERDRGEAVPSRAHLSGFSGRSEIHEMTGDEDAFEMLEESAHSSRRWMDLEAAELHAARARGAPEASLGQLLATSRTAPAGRPIRRGRASRIGRRDVVPQARVESGRRRGRRVPFARVLGPAPPRGHPRPRWSERSPRGATRWTAGVRAGTPRVASASDAPPARDLPGTRTLCDRRSPRRPERSNHEPPSFSPREELKELKAPAQDAMRSRAVQRAKAQQTVEAAPTKPATPVRGETSGVLRRGGPARRRRRSARDRKASPSCGRGVTARAPPKRRADEKLRRIARGDPRRHRAAARDDARRAERRAERRARPSGGKARKRGRPRRCAGEDPAGGAGGRGEVGRTRPAARRGRAVESRVASSADARAPRRVVSRTIGGVPRRAPSGGAAARRPCVDAAR